MPQSVSALRLRRWALALLFGLGFLLLTGQWLHTQQQELAQRVLRLHVLANSDSPEDQQLKLLVRDQILEQARAVLPEQGGRDEAERALQDNLEILARAGARVVDEQGYDYPVRVSLEESWFPTKQYEDFALPAGTYRALRVEIGEGEGRNWWCVVFPPLCLGSVSETCDRTALEEGLGEGNAALVTGEDGGYVIKFKAIELWERLCAAVEE